VNFAEFTFNLDQAYHITSEQFDKENLIKEKAIVRLSEETSLAPLNLVQVIILVAIAILLPIGICLFAIKLWHHWNGFRIASTEEDEILPSYSDSPSEQEESFLEKLVDAESIDQSNLTEEEELLSSSTTYSTSEQEKPVLEKLADFTVIDKSNLAEITRQTEPVPFCFIINKESSLENIRKTAETKALHLNAEQYQFLSNEKINWQKTFDYFKLDELENPVTIKLDDPTDEFPLRGLLNPQTAHLRAGLRDPGFAMLGETLNLILEMENFKKTS
jgi:hypothetical protein